MNTQQVSASIENRIHQPLFPNAFSQVKDCREDTEIKLIRLSLDQIKAYEHNPRQQKNAMYEELKASIRERGMDVPFHVTRRPGDDCYMVESGGNTRLSILKELWQETGDERYFYLQVMFRPWVSELHVLTAHLTENIMRSDMCFYDRAKAVLDIKKHIEQLEGNTLKWAEFERRLEQMGIKHSHGQIVRMRYLIETLDTMLPESLRQHIGPHHVQRLQSTFKELSAGMREPFPTDNQKSSIRDVFDTHGTDFEEAIQAIAALAPKSELGSDEYADSYEPDLEDDLQPGVEDDVPVADGSSCVMDEARSQAPCVIEEEMNHGIHSQEESDFEDVTSKQIYRLQRIIELRSKLYHHARQLIGDDVWVTDNAFGFGVNITDDECPIQELIAQMSAYGLGSESPTIDVSKIFMIDHDEFASFMKILSLSKQIVETTQQLQKESVVQDDVDDLSNGMIINLQNELDPNVKAENEMIRSYIMKDATNTMLLSVFPMLSLNEVVHIREELGIENNGGRPLKSLPDEAEHIRILYQKHSREMEDRELYLFISEQVDLPLSTVWNTIQSFQPSNQDAE